jgi:hypothetical protein
MIMVLRYYNNIFLGDIYWVPVKILLAQVHISYLAGRLARAMLRKIFNNVEERERGESNHLAKQPSHKLKFKIVWRFSNYCTSCCSHTTHNIYFFPQIKGYGITTA